MISHTAANAANSGPHRGASTLLLAAALLPASLGLAACQSGPPSPTASVPDGQFQACLRYYRSLSLNRASGPTTIAQLNRITGIVGCTNQGVASIEGAQYLTSADSLLLRMDQISDLTPLTGLTNLTGLDLGSNHISDITPLARLNNLTWISLDGNQISDTTPLTGLTNLTELGLGSNHISDTTPLAGLTNLTSLNLSGNQINDSGITPLAGLTNLTELDLISNHISDTTPLAGLTNLTSLNLSGNQISDTTPLAGLTNLTSLNLSGNQISDVSALAGLTDLTSLNLSGNQISDVSALAGLPAVKATTGHVDDLWCVLDDQQLAATARTGPPQPLPNVAGLGTVSWQVTQGDAIVNNGAVTYRSAGTVALKFTDSGSTFSGTVTVTVIS